MQDPILGFFINRFEFGNSVCFKNSLVQNVLSKSFRSEESFHGKPSATLQIAKGDLARA
jgi:hypothetical protein